MNRVLKSGVKAFSSMPIEIKAIDKENYRLTMVASTQSVDRHGDTIMQAGWDLKNFKKNPVILNSHNYYDATEVIARAENTRVEGTGKSAKLVQDWVFAVNENPKAKIIWDLYVGKFLHASSVGFIPTKFAEKEDGSRDWYVIEEAELLEVSAVSVPANATALLAKSIGVDVKELESVVTVDPEEEAEAEPEAEETTETPATEETQGAEEATEETPTEPETPADPPEVAEEPEATPEAADDEPAPVQATYAKKALAAIHKMESREKRAYRRAGAIIDSLLNDEHQKVGKATREQLRLRKVNQAIRELLKTK